VGDLVSIETLWNMLSAILRPRVDFDHYSPLDSRVVSRICQLFRQFGIIGHDRCSPISVRFAYESRDPSGQWWRSHGNEHWAFSPDGLMSRRDASINDVRISAHERRIV
jgi:nuclear transport factor 2 (NTF2) superfamily protein